MANHPSIHPAVKMWFPLSLMRWSVLIIVLLLSPSIETQSLFSELQNLATTAESIFEGLSYGLQKVREGLKTFHGVMDTAVERECKFTCPEARKTTRRSLAHTIIDFFAEKFVQGYASFFPQGKTMQKNPKHKSHEDGCGAYGIYLTEKDLPAPDMVKCCNQHDACYDVCGVKKVKCDEKFEKCLYDSCERSKKKKGSEYQTCKAGAKLLYLGTLALGCKAYLDSQARSCSCVERSEF